MKYLVASFLASMVFLGNIGWKLQVRNAHARCGDDIQGPSMYDTMHLHIALMQVTHASSYNLGKPNPHMLRMARQRLFSQCPQGRHPGLGPVLFVGDSLGIIAFLVPWPNSLSQVRTSAQPSRTELTALWS